MQHGSVIGLCGADDGAESSVGVRAPFRAEPVGHLAKDHAGPQRAFEGVVGGRHVAVRDEHEQVLARAVQR